MALWYIEQWEKFKYLAKRAFKLKQKAFFIFFQQCLGAKDFLRPLKKRVQCNWGHWYRNRWLRYLLHICIGDEINFMQSLSAFLLFLYNWDSLHAKLNRNYKAWSYKENRNKTKSKKESYLEENKNKSYLLILD